MYVKCKNCGRIHEVKGRKLSGIRPSNYLCKSCIDNGVKISVGVIGGLFAVVGSLKILTNVFRKK